MRELVATISKALKAVGRSLNFILQAVGATERLDRDTCGRIYS